MSKHIANISIRFSTLDPADDPDMAADILVQDLINAGYDATLDDVSDDDATPQYIHPYFVVNSLEGGHGEDFRAIFVCRRVDDKHYCIESVDVQALFFTGAVNIGAIGGEIVMRCPISAVTKERWIEEMCRNFLFEWHLKYSLDAEDSVVGMYRIIKSIVHNGKFFNSEIKK
jgi:hypothetical protein